MSGGHWGYKSQDIRMTAAFVADALETLALIERILDWGICGDTSMEQAKQQTINKLIAFFDRHYGGGE